MSVYIITEAWGETTITWQNRPIDGSLIDAFDITGNTHYTIDMSDYIQGDGVTICINATNTGNGVLMGYSKEDPTVSLIESNYPQIIWTYDKGFISGYEIIYLIGVICITSTILIRRKLS